MFSQLFLKKQRETFDLLKSNGIPLLIYYVIDILTTHYLIPYLANQ